MRRSFSFLGFLLLAQTYLHAQFSDSLEVSIGTITTMARKSYQPLWITANQYGTLSNRQADFASHIRLSNQHVIGMKKRMEKEGASTRNLFSIMYGLDIYNNNHFQNFFIKEGFLKLALKDWELRAGRYEEILGEVDPVLSSGSLGISSNSLPIPQIGIKLTQYKDIPFTNGWLQAKGQFSHGWLGKNNFVKDAYLHQKSIYLKLGKHNFQFYGGLNHFAQWGGKHPLGPAPSRFKDFLRIVTASSGDADDPVYQQGSIDIANAVGNHILTSDFGFVLKKNGNTFKLYTQTIFEKGRADSANMRDRLDGLKIFGRDRLVGFSWETNKQVLLNKATLEWIYTKYQGGSIMFDGRDNYYNNATYATGWQYQDRIIGTPLFINRQDATHYNLDTNTNAAYRWNIVSNRIAGFHLGFKGSISKKLGYRILATHLKHYGNYYNDDAFAPFKSQNHFLVEGLMRLTNSLVLAAAVGQDFGDITNNTGGRLRLEWNIIKPKRITDNSNPGTIKKKDTQLRVF